MYRNLSTQGLGISGVESEIIELAVTYKFKGIDPDLDELYHRSEEKGVKYARRLVESAEMNLGPFRLAVNWADDEAYERDMPLMTKIAARAVELGCPRAVTLVEPGCDQRPYHENFEFHRRRLGELAKAFGEHGVRLGLEHRAAAEARKGHAFEFIHTFADLRKLAEEIGNPSVGVVIDAWQWYIGGGTLEDFEGLTSEQIVAVSLSDAPADVPRDELTDKQRLLPGETGAIDSAGIVKLLIEIGYDGPITARPDRSRFPKTGRLQIVRMIAESLNQVWVAAGLEPEATPSPSPPPTADAAPAAQEDGKAE